jgi:hypothetical protein
MIARTYSMLRYTYIDSLAKFKNRRGYRFNCGILQCCKCGYNYYIISGQHPHRDFLQRLTVLIWTLKYFVSPPYNFQVYARHSDSTIAYTAGDWWVRCKYNCETFLISPHFLVKYKEYVVLLTFAFERNSLWVSSSLFVFLNVNLRYFLMLSLRVSGEYFEVGKQPFTRKSQFTVRDSLPLLT